MLMAQGCLVCQASPFTRRILWMAAKVGRLPASHFGYGTALPGSATAIQCQGLGGFRFPDREWKVGGRYRGRNKWRGLWP